MYGTYDIFKEKIPADDETNKLANSNVAVHIGRAETKSKHFKLHAFVIFPLKLFKTFLQRMMCAQSFAKQKDKKTGHTFTNSPTRGPVLHFLHNKQTNKETNKQTNKQGKTNKQTKYNRKNTKPAKRNASAKFCIADGREKGRKA